LLKKDTLSSSKSGEYTGEWLPLKYMVLRDRRFLLCIWLSVNPLNAELNLICYLLALLGTHHIFHVSRIRVNISQRVVNSILVLSLYTVIHSCTWKYAMSQSGKFTNSVQGIAFILSTRN
jgi:hypothetical protein